MPSLRATGGRVPAKWGQDHALDSEALFLNLTKKILPNYMIKHTSQLSVAIAACVALSVSAFADVKVNDNISVNGYAVGSYTYTDTDGAPTRNTWLDSGSNSVDAVKLGVLGTAGSVSAYGSVLYLPGAANEAGMLDAYATIDTGTGVKLTGGKFLSYLGYEAFDAVNMTQLSYALISGIPAYHTGAKLDYTGKGFTVGVAAVDSIFSGAKGFFEGDREFDDDIGIEIVGTYTGIDKLTIFGGVALEDTEGAADKTAVYDLWASYALSSTVTLAAEYCINDNVADSWLVFASLKSSDAVSTIFRISGINYDGGGDDMKYTVAPTYTLNSNLSFRGEISFSEGDSGDVSFYGVQAVLKF